MPEGRYVLRHKGDGFVPHIRDKYDAQYDWLEWLSYSQNIVIQHGRNGGEYRVGLYFVDGYHAASHTCHGFQGCWWHFHAGHGDSECVLTSRQKTSASLQHRCERTERRRQFIEKRGYRYVEIWECEWIDMNKNNPNVQKFMSARNPSFFKTMTPTKEQLLEAVVAEQLYGVVEVDIRVPTQWPDIMKNRPDFSERFAQHTPYDYFSEMSPCFVPLKSPFPPLESS